MIFAKKYFTSKKFTSDTPTVEASSYQHRTMHYLRVLRVETNMIRRLSKTKGERA